MTFSIIRSHKLQCDIRAIVSLSNRLQAFFLVEYSGRSAQLPSKPLYNNPLTWGDIEDSLRKQNLLDKTFPEQRYILLTGRRLASPFLQQDPNLIILSEQLRPRSSGSTKSLWFATQILRAGLVSLIARECHRDFCVCSSSAEFHFLCTDCEERLRGFDFRDAFRHLRSTLQWLLEQRTTNTTAQSPPPLTPIPARLRLAEYYSKRATARGTFAGNSILMVLHFLSDLLPFVRALHAMGAVYQDMILIAKPYPYPKRDYVSHELQRLGVRVYRATKDRPVSTLAYDLLCELKHLKSFAQKKMIIIKDGGYFTPLLHQREFSTLRRNYVGTVEQTTKGIRADEKIKNPRSPILSVAKCAFKSNYEAPEIGRVTVQNIARFVPNIKLSGSHAVVFGFGDIGAQVAYHLNKSFNMAVSIVDKTSDKILHARHRRDCVAEAESSFSQLAFKDRAVLVVGTTGEQSISETIVRQLPNECVIVSTSSDRVEIDVAALERLAEGRIHEIEEGKQIFSIRVGGKTKVLTLLAEAFPINFYGSESLPNASIDPVMTLLLLCAEELARGAVHKPGIQDDTVNEIVANRQLIKKFLSLSQYQ